MFDLILEIETDTLRNFGPSAQKHMRLYFSLTYLYSKHLPAKRSRKGVLVGQWLQLSLLSKKVTGVLA